MVEFEESVLYKLLISENKSEIPKIISLIPILLEKEKKDPLSHPKQPFKCSETYIARLVELATGSSSLSAQSTPLLSAQRKWLGIFLLYKLLPTMQFKSLNIYLPQINGLLVDIFSHTGTKTVNKSFIIALFLYRNILVFLRNNEVMYEVRHKSVIEGISKNLLIFTRILQKPEKLEELKDRTYIHDLEVEILRTFIFILEIFPAHMKKYYKRIKCICVRYLGDPTPNKLRNKLCIQILAKGFHCVQYSSLYFGQFISEILRDLDLYLSAQRPKTISEKPIELLEGMNEEYIFTDMVENIEGRVILAQEKNLLTAYQRSKIFFKLLKMSFRSILGQVVEVDIEGLLQVLFNIYNLNDAPLKHNKFVLGLDPSAYNCLLAYTKENVLRLLNFYIKTLTSFLTPYQGLITQIIKRSLTPDPNNQTSESQFISTRLSLNVLISGLNVFRCGMYEITREYLFKENENIFELCLKYLGEVLMLMDNTVIKVDERLTLIKTKQSLRKAGKKRAKGLGTDYDSACVESESTHISTLIQFIYSYLSCIKAFTESCIIIIPPKDLSYIECIFLNIYSLSYTQAFINLPPQIRILIIEIGEIISKHNMSSREPQSPLFLSGYMNFLAKGGVGETGRGEECGELQPRRLIMRSIPQSGREVGGMEKPILWYKDILIQNNSRIIQSIIQEEQTLGENNTPEIQIKSLEIESTGTQVDIRPKYSNYQMQTSTLSPPELHQEPEIIDRKEKYQIELRSSRVQEVEHITEEVKDEDLYIGEEFSTIRGEIQGESNINISNIKAPTKSSLLDSGEGIYTMKEIDRSDSEESFLVPSIHLTDDENIL